MILRIIFFTAVALLLFGSSSCKVRKEYIEKNGLHSGDKPSQIAKEIGDISQKQKKAYRKQLRKTAKSIKKRNLKKAQGNYYKRS